MKKVLTSLSIILMLAIGVVVSYVFNYRALPSADKKIESEENSVSVQTVSMPRLLGSNFSGYITRSGQTGVSKRVSATVQPASATNKLVDYTVFWDVGATRVEEPVSDYIIVEQDSDGSTDATVTCIQSFGEDTIILEVITRDGGYTAECVITYVGFLTEMSITSDTLSTVNTQARGDYYEVLTNNTYTFDINMDNVLHDVANYDLSVELGGVGQFYFFDRVAYMRGIGGIPSIDEPTLYNLGDMADKFLSVELNGNVMEVSVKSKALVNYYVEYPMSFNNVRTCVYSSVNWVVSSFTDDNGTQHSVNKRNSENNAMLSSAYFTVTVTDANTNISSEIKLWVESSVDGVRLSTNSLEF